MSVGPCGPLLGLSLVLLAPRALAQEEPPLVAEPDFGDRGIIAVSDDAAFVMGRTFYGRSSRTGTFFFTLAPIVDYFVARRVSIGFGVVSDLELGESDTIYSLGPRARVGTVFRISRSVSFWARAGFGYAWFTVDTLDVAATEHALFIHIAAPLLIHPAPHFFIGAGPTFFGELVRESSPDRGERPLSYFVGATLTLGGWW